MTVLSPTRAQLASFNGGSIYGSWASVLEEAYALYRGPENDGPDAVVSKNANQSNPGSAHQVWLKQRADSVPQMNLSKVSTGMNAWAALMILTGRPVKPNTIESFSESGLARNLENDFDLQHPADLSNHKAVLAGRNIDDLLKDRNFSLPAEHLYCVLGFDPDGAGGGTVKIGNPYNGKDGTPDGVFALSLRDFMSSFSMIFEEQ
jgi:hypothetical protein